jgi:site-specific recombinase XerD
VSGIRHLRFHDLRGTAATNFVRAGLDLHDVATVLGWSKAKVEQIAARYVTAKEVGLAMVEKLRRNRLETDFVNRAVNRKARPPFVRMDCSGNSVAGELGLVPRSES